MDALVNTQWLADALGANDLRVIDASYFLPEHGRDAATEFCDGHIPGAAFLDLATLADNASPLPSTLPPPEQLASRMRALGIGDGSRIVLYDNGPLRSAARAWWLLHAHGTPDVAILDGGLGKWRAEGRPLEKGLPKRRESHFTIRESVRGMRSLAEMRSISVDGSAQIADARSPARFAGSEPEARPGVEAGHIPGSCNLPFGNFFDSDGCWKRGDALRAVFAESGIDPARPLVATCGSGVTAAVIVFAAHLLGHDASLYDGSWAEWGSDPTTPQGTSMSDSKKDFTRAVTGGRRPEWTQGIVSTPVWRASTILYDSVADLREAGGRDTHHRLFYGRRGTPTQWSLAEAITEMEPDAEATLLYPSGVAAVASALFAVLGPGDELLVPDNAYDPTRGLANGLLKRFGVATTFYDPLVGEGIAGLITERTRAIFLESPGSLTFEVQDVPAIVGVAKDKGLVTLIDNTWATPMLLPAIGMGVDYSILAGTKYIGGHSDVMLGTVTAAKGKYAKLRDASYQLGQTASPDDAWLGSRGMRTLALRMQQHGRSALQVAQWLRTRPEVARVLHPGLPECPGHENYMRDFRGGSGLFSFILNGGDDAARAALIDGLTHFGIGFSWGGFESLALPIDPARYRTATPWQAEGPAIRLHIGLEDPDDLIADLEAGFNRYQSAT